MLVNDPSVLHLHPLAARKRMTSSGSLGSYGVYMSFME
ncbi:hypothetical protein FOXYSP1_08305 [Fusarium oxysporum f. sp. phaseoli]